MKKSLLSALGLSVALAFSMPALGNAAATTTAAPAAATTTTAPAAAATTTAPAKAAPKKVAKKAVCKVTKKHKCPVKKAPAKAAPRSGGPRRGGPEGCSEEALISFEVSSSKAVPAATGWGGLLPNAWSN
ncbi:hypothetical protein [Mesorhizobium huakuii]|uniref:hypothetical protein n=1 Tax=Mesorhizobium huakuii TaxID=28104 RepID=UPI001FD0FBC0|nr:hypothetical protein [Mesorhizobium huakuii]